MAKDNIAQMFRNVKNEKSIHAKLSELSGELSEELLRRERSANADMILAPIIFHATVREARELTDLIGWDVFLPHTDYTTLERIADFYGVEAAYIKNLFVRYGIVYTKMPDDVVRVSGECVAAALGRYDDVCVRVDMDSRQLHKQILVFKKSSCGKAVATIPKKGISCFYSARVFLATASLMSFGQSVPKDSQASKVVEILRRSVFYSGAKEVAARNEADLKKELSNSTQKDGSDLGKVQSEPSGVKIAPDGELVVAPEVFVQIIKVSVREAVASSLPSILDELRVDRAVYGRRPSDAKKFPSKLKKPGNWDDVLASWEDGRLTTKQAANATRMSESSFRNYARGRKTFD